MTPKDTMKHCDGPVVNQRLMRAYFMRKAREQQHVIDSVRVFSKRYMTAVDEFEEIEELLALQRTQLHAARTRR